MNALLRRRLERATRVRDFLRAHPTDSVAEKTAFALGPLVFGLILDAQQSSADSVRYAAALIPAAASVVSAMILLAYRLDAELRR